MRRVLAAVLLCASLASAQSPGPLRVTIRAGPETDGEGAHDRPPYLAEWTKLLGSRGCTVRGSLEFPSSDVLAASDVLLLVAAEGASIAGEERARLETYLARGGGLVVLHDALRGDDPAWFETIAGGAWEDGRSQSLEGPVDLRFSDREHPITEGVANFVLADEVAWNLRLAHGAHVLASAEPPDASRAPQMWVFEEGGHRAFVALQGHDRVAFVHPAWRTLILRGIAWVGRRDADALVTPEEVAGLSYPPGGPLAPEKAAASIALHPDFEIALVAAEPLIAKPISLDWDARGRMWVASTPGHPEKAALADRPGRDSIAILADTDGDGRMDERKEFVDGLDLVTSLVFHKDGVIVAQAPEILYLSDRDGDDRADESVVLYSGFGSADADAVVSNLRWGLDGWIYATQGTSGVDSRHVIGPSGQDFGPIGSGVFRFRPDGTAIEMVAACSTNAWGLDSTWDGELFFAAASAPHLRHVVLPERVLASGPIGAASSAAGVSDPACGIAGAAGGCFYTGGWWPSEFDGDHFTCDPALGIVHHERLTPQGTTFAASRPSAAEFLTSTDPWFWPLHLRVGPDGALYVLDFYEQALARDDPHGRGSDASADPRPDRGDEHGRIWRIQHRAARPLALPRLWDSSEAELLSVLEHQNAWQRQTVQRLLLESKPSPEALGELAHKALNSYRPQAKVHALWILALEDPERLTRILDHLLRDPEASVRRNAVTALGTLDAWQLARVASRALSLTDDPDPRTALAAIVALGDVLAAERARELLARYPTLGDDVQRSAVLAVAARSPAKFVAASMAQPEPERLVELVTALAEGVGRRGALKQAVEIVLALGDAKSRSPIVAESALRALERTLDPELLPWSSTPLDKALLHLVENESVEVAIAALPLAQRWSRDGKVESASKALGRRIGVIAADPAQAPAVRAHVLTTMLGLAEERSAAIEITASLLGPALPLAVQLELIEALARSSDPAAARALCAAYPRLSRPARERVFERLVERAEWTAALLDALEADAIDALDLGPQRLHRLRNHPDAGVAARARAILDARTEVGALEAGDKDALIAELLPLVEHGGEPVRGRTVYLENCASCHSLRGVAEQAGVGPDLTGRGVLGAGQLLPFLVDPDRAIDPAYVEFVAETADGRLVDGVLARETADAIVLRNSGGEHELRRGDVVELRSTGRSPMPSGFETLGPDALRDLFAFLRAGSAGAAPAAGGIETPR